MPDGPAPTEPLQTITEETGLTLLLTDAEARVYNDLVRVDTDGQGARGGTVVRAFVELGVLRHRLETMPPAGLAADAAVANQDALDPRTTIDGMLRAILADQDRATFAAADQVRDLAVALAALGGLAPTPITVENDHELLRIAARDLVKVLERFSVDDFAGRLEDLVAPLNAIERALELQA